ncbi:MAG: DUF6768 family protein [Planctomycetota bacterium]|jgi:hypothetical protein
MNEHENELSKALAENGNFDAEKAQRLSAEAVSRYHAWLRWTERVTLIFVLLFVVVGLAAYSRFLVTSNTKAMIGCAILVLIAYETTVLVKLWNCVIDNKLSVLKEIKQLRLEGVTRLAAAGLPSATKSAMSTLILGDGLPRWERIAWILAVASLFGAAGFWTVRQIDAGPPAPTVEAYVTLTPTGTGTEVMKVSYPYFGFVPRTSFPFTASDAAASIRWIDSQGRELPASVSTSNGQRHYTVQLVEPVMPGDQVRYTQITQSPTMATEEDALWTYRMRRAFGHEKKGPVRSASHLVVGSPLVDNREPDVVFSETVQLPEGAEVVSAEPQPAWWAIWDGTPTDGFRATRDRNEDFTYTIQYRLPRENATAKAPQ